MKGFMITEAFLHMIPFIVVGGGLFVGIAWALRAKFPTS
jgi:hypothetical protein